MCEVATAGASQGKGYADVAQSPYRRVVAEPVKGIIESTIQKVVGPARRKAAGDAKSLLDAKVDDAMRRLLSLSFHGIEEEIPVALVSFGFNETQLDYAQVNDILLRDISVNPVVDSESLSWEQGNSVFELSLAGHFHNASFREYKAMQSQRRFHSMGGAPEPGASMLNSTPLQWTIVSTALSMAKLLGHLQIKLPWQVTVSIVGASGYFLLDSETHLLSPKAIGPDNLRLRTARITSKDQFEDPVAIGRVLKDSIDYLCRTVGWDRSHCYTSTGIFNVRIF